MAESLNWGSVLTLSGGFTVHVFLLVVARFRDLDEVFIFATIFAVPSSSA
jgi:hypothetical protein